MVRKHLPGRAAQRSTEGTTGGFMMQAFIRRVRQMRQGVFLQQPRKHKVFAGTCKSTTWTSVDDDGVLVLSEFAGAAVELAAAVITNPFSSRSMDSAILQALGMPLEERQHRMRALRRVVKRFSVTAWMQSQEQAFDAAIARRSSAEDN
jgi:trehalose-6-phosphate synthase